MQDLHPFFAARHFIETHSHIQYDPLQWGSQINFATQDNMELGDAEIHANRAQVQQVVINLLLNAVDALATVEDRDREIVLSSRRLAPGTIEISVADNGPGVAPANREHIFNALFSTKANGTGVGLSISRAIAEAHGGHIAYRPRTPHGALFSLVLSAAPVDDGSAAA